MNQTADPVPFNPWLGLAVKGMWSTAFTSIVIAAAPRDDSEHAPEAEAA